MGICIFQSNTLDMIIYKNQIDRLYLPKKQLWRKIMELYLFAALLMFYIITSFVLQKFLVRRIWTLAFIFSFAITALSIASIRVSGQDVMMAASELNWYYMLYLFGSLSVVLGLINLWMFRHAVWHIFTDKEDKTENDDDDDID